MRRGFTLMDVLLALVIVVGLMGAMFGLYWRGLEVRDRTTAILEEVTAQRLLLDRISGELQTAMVYPFLQFGLSGDAGRAEWITCRLPGPATWLPRDTTERPATPQSDIHIVGYRLRYGEDDNGEEVVLGLERRVQTVLAPETAEEGEGADGAAVDVRFVTDHVKLLRFRFFDGVAWSESWAKCDLPTAVEIVIGAEPIGEEASLAEYAAQTMRRVIYVPGGLAAQGAVVRGLGEGGAP